MLKYEGLGVRGLGIFVDFSCALGLTLDNPGSAFLLCDGVLIDYLFSLCRRTLKEIGSRAGREKRLGRGASNQAVGNLVIHKMTGVPRKKIASRLRACW